MSKLSDDAKDGLMKSDYNQSDEMKEMLEERNDVVKRGIGRGWIYRTNSYRSNYDKIKWK